MESPIIAASAEPHIPPLPSPDRQSHRGAAGRPEEHDLLSFEAWLEDERALLARALDAFQVELGGAVAG